MLLNNQQIIEEIQKEIKMCIETNENENTTTQNLWDIPPQNNQLHLFLKCTRNLLQNRSHPGP